MGAEGKIKIAFVEGRYDSFYGGQRSMATLIQNLPEEKFNPVVVTTNEGELSRELTKKGVEVEIVPINPLLNKFGGVLFDYSLTKKIKAAHELLKYNLKISNWLKKNNIDIVYVNEFRSLLYCGLAARIRGLPLLRYIRGTGGKIDQLTGKMKSVLDFIGLRVPTKIITISDGVRRMYSENQLEKHSEKFTTLYTGFDFEDLNYDKGQRKKDKEEVHSDYNIPESAKVIGLVGSICHRKGHDLLVEAAPKIIEREENAHFLLVGGSPAGQEGFKEEIKEKTENKDLSSRFHWTGYQDDIKKFYNGIDLLVLPSRGEGLPRTVIEGLAMGLPVVATDAGGTKEIITEREHGKVIEKENTEQLAEAVTECLKDKDLIKKHRKERYNYVKNKFSIKSYVEGFEEIIEEVLAS